MKTQQTDGSAAGCRAVRVVAFAVLGWQLLSGTLGAALSGCPTNNPVAHLKLPWTDEIKWANVLDVTQVPGKDILEKIASAQDQLAARGATRPFRAAT